MERLKVVSFVNFWSILGLLSMITIWLLPWRFQTNDDEIMMWLVSGAYTGTPESYAVFIHPLLSWIFAQLYSLFPSISWYPLAWFIVIYLSYEGLILSLNRSKIGIYGINIFAIFCLFLFLHFCLFLQFTIVAGVAGFSGLLLPRIWNRKESKIIFLFSILLIVFSIMIRWESFMLILLAFGFYFLIFKSNREILTYSKPFVVSLLLLIVLIGSKFAWERQSDYADFVAYNKARAAVSDHPVSYKLFLEEKLDRESKWFFFSHWMMEDDKLTLENLKERKSELDNEFFSFAQFSNSFSRLFSVLKAEAFKTVFSFLLIFIYLFSFKAGRRSLVFLSAWMLFFLIVNHFFILNGRVVILFILPILFPLILEPTCGLIGKRALIFANALLLLLFGYHLKNFLAEANARQIMQEEFLSLTENLPSEVLLVMEGYKENYLGINYTMEYPVPFLSLGWISKSPFQNTKLQKISLSKISETYEFYLLGVDVNQEFYFPEYMNYLIGDFQLESTRRQENFILFHYTKSH